MRGFLAPGGIALVAVTTFAAPAYAQQRQPQQATWTGGQIGGFGGFSTLGGNFAEPGAHFCGFGFSPMCPEVPFSFGAGSPTSATGGVFAGYTIPWSVYAVGIEADIAAKNRGTSSVQGNMHFPGPVADPVGTGTTETFTGSLSQRWDASIRGRFGVPINYSRTLLYATGGVAFGKVSGSFSYAATAAPGAAPPISVPAAGMFSGGGAQSWSDTRLGYTIGGGVEWAYWQNVKLRVEYRYTDFGSFSKDVPLATSGACGPPSCLPTGNAHIDMRANFHTLRFGIGFGI